MISCSNDVANKMRVDSEFDDWCKRCLNWHSLRYDLIVSIWSRGDDRIIITTDNGKTGINFTWEI